MQTFLPYPDIQKSLESLDNKRLGKQRVEAYQIISAITGRKRLDGKPYKGWLNHPCSVMWREYVDALKFYYNTSIEVWVSRGFKNTMKFEDIPDNFELPKWIGNSDFHSSHRANLLRKDPEYYTQFGWTENPENPYLWLDENKKWYAQLVGEKQRVYL